MAKRFISTIFLAILALSEGTTWKGETEDISVNANRVNQGLEDLKNGTSRLTNRMTIDYSPMNCRVQKYRGAKYYGTIATSGNWIDTEDICVSICWQYKTQGYPCESVNYIQSKKTCELMQDVYGQSSNGQIKEDSTSSYIIPVSCEQPGQPSKPTPAPAPTPAPQPDAGSGSTSSIRPGSCGQTSVPNRVSLSRSFHRIVGGVESRPHSIPWIVSLRSNGWHYCGGTLVRVNSKDESDIVITAAHCMKGDSANFDVVAGAHFRGRKEPGEESVRAARVVSHPNYNKPRGNDIAIVKLSRPIKFSNTIQPACLPAKNEGPADGKNGIVAGWGALQEGGGGPEALNQVIVPVIGTSACQRYYGVDPASELCAGYDQGQKDSCQGDSGGPYFLEGKNGYTLQGVVSWGSGCARPRAPGVYARVSNYEDWIQSQIRALSSVRA